MSAAFVHNTTKKAYNLLPCDTELFITKVLGLFVRSNLQKPYKISLFFFFIRFLSVKKRKQHAPLGMCLQDASHCSWPVKGFKMFVYFQRLRQKQCPSLI